VIRLALAVSITLCAATARAQVSFPEQKPMPVLSALDDSAGPAEPKLDKDTLRFERPEQLLERLQDWLFPGGFRFAVHGYFRAPLRLGIRPRTTTMEGQASNNVRTPWLVDDDYFRSGFAYTRLQESDWAELYLSAGNKNLMGTVALMRSPILSGASRRALRGRRAAGVARHDRRSPMRSGRAPQSPPSSRRR